jgi:Rad3-related DNA helicase
LISLPLSDDTQGGHLVMDLRDPSHLLETESLTGLQDLPASAIIFTQLHDDTYVLAAGDKTLISRKILWSLLDPLRAGQGIAPLIHDRFVAEQQLRAEGARFWQGIESWQLLPEADRLDYRFMLAPHAQQFELLFDQLNALGRDSHANPFADYIEEKPGDAEPQVDSAVQLPQSPHDLADWYAEPLGLGAIMGEGFQPRPQQGDMARDIMGALQSDSPLLMEAGTGTGKTLAYLIPLLADCIDRERRGVISTHTLALQAQILRQDLPRIHRLFPGVTFRRLMGRKNYICRTRIDYYLRQPVKTLQEALTNISFRVWLNRTVDGMREEVTDHPFLKQKIGTLFESPEPCSPAVCYGKNECPVQRARRRAREADIVLVNHSLLMNDFAAGHTLIGDYEALIVDEAHRLPQVALDTFTVDCDRYRAIQILDMLEYPAAEKSESALLKLLAHSLRHAENAQADAAEAVESLSIRLRRALTVYQDWLKTLGAMLKEKIPEGETRTHRVRIYDADEAFRPAQPVFMEFMDACAAVSAANVTLSAKLDSIDDLTPGQQDIMATVGRAIELLMALQTNLMFMVSGGEEDWVKWFDFNSESGMRATGATRLESGELLGDLWRKSEMNPVMTSATLGVNGNFDLSRRELGLSRISGNLIISEVLSPFVYEEQCRFLTSPSFPAPNSSAFLPAISKLVGDLNERVPRKTMVLFTAYNSLRYVAGELQKKEETLRGGQTAWAADRTVILSQGSGVAPQELVSRFRLERRAVLLGTNTFWEGVDFPGDDLEVLIVTKLPFLVPADPWVEARSERVAQMGENPFTKFMLADAVLRLRQGIGRLIRSSSDKGVIILLDSRLHSKPYGMTFLKALPAPARFCADAEDIVTQTESFFNP